MSYKAHLIDDNKAVLFFNKLILERSGFFSEVKISENGAEAMDLISDGFSADIVFLDINMPVMNGWDFLKKFMELENQGLIILMSGAPLNEEGTQKLNTYPSIVEVIDKMLSKGIVNEIKTKYLK